MVRILRFTIINVKEETIKIERIERITPFYKENIEMFYNIKRSFF